MRRLGALGVLSPQVQTGLRDHLQVVEDLHAQVLFDLRTIADQGQDPSDFAAEAQEISAAIGEVQADMTTADDTDSAALHARVNILEQQARDLITRTSRARQGAVEGQQVTGLLWGLGVAAGVAALAWFVWDRRKRRRR